MTRINCVPVAELTREHLVAEYRELPRAFTELAKRLAKGKDKAHDPTQAYTLGKGHVLFFYTRLAYLARRHDQLVAEMVKRGYHPKYDGGLWLEWQGKIPERFWNDWTPTEKDMMVNRERIINRLLGL